MEGAGSGIVGQRVEGGEVVESRVIRQREGVAVGARRELSSERRVVQWEGRGIDSGSFCDVVSPSLANHTQHPLTHSTGYHQNLLQLNQLVPCSGQMVGVISESQPLWDHCNSLVRIRVTKIQLIMNDYTCKLAWKFGAY